MSVKQLSADLFLEQSANQAVLDVRTPAEFEAGHIPGAINMPLFENDERAVVGKLYKQVHRDAAMIEGLRIVGPKLAHFVEKAKFVATDRKLGIYCWRGGMRSGSVAQLLDMAGFTVQTLKDGYKGFRRYGLELMSKPLPFMVLAGCTGSGKTDLLYALAKEGEFIIDLEGIAHHKGSAFGGLMQEKQPTTEHSQNILISSLHSFRNAERIWVEDESMSIGSVYLSELFWNQLHASPLVLIERSKEARVHRLANEYGMASVQLVIERIKRIQRKLGGLSTKEAIEYVELGDVEAAASILLQYYDKAYAKSLAGREKQIVLTISADGISDSEIAQKILLATKANRR